MTADKSNCLERSYHDRKSANQNDKYYIVINDCANGKRRQSGSKTGLSAKGNKRRAEQMLRDVVQDYERQRGIIRSDVTLADYVRQWMVQAKRRVDEVTYQGYEALANGHILPYFDANGVKLQDVTHRQLQAYIDEKGGSRAQGRQGRSVRPQSAAA